MHNIALVILLILALCLIGIVLMQRSEGGGLGIGGGGGGMSGRPKGNAMTKMTWIIAVGFMATCLFLVIINAREGSLDSILERTGATTLAPVEPDAETATEPLSGADLLPPTPTDDAAAPPKAEE